MRTTKEKIAIMQAFEDGKPIEMKNASSAQWSTLSMGKSADPIWNWGSCDYRIKQEPKVVYINYYEDYEESEGYSPYGDVYDSEEDAIEGRGDVGKTLKFIEVLE
jgi:hypothetical protein